mmetsp:Transcript_32472/g.73591  ORF Transcript_32472/g.73591 Transcript_32472/m.73591 type:complete len:121 (-) Transcript_32472:85-447(-)
MVRVVPSVLIITGPISWNEMVSPSWMLGIEGSFVASGSFNTSASSLVSSLAAAHDDAALFSSFSVDIPATASNRQRRGRKALDRLLTRMMMAEKKTKRCLIGPRKNDHYSANQVKMPHCP